MTVPPSQPQDQEASKDLVAASTRGDRGALEALLERHIPALHAFVRLRAGPVVKEWESASDLVQSVCREVLEDLPRHDYRGEGAFRHWLFTTALHKIIDRGRFYGRRAARSTPLAGATPSDSASGSDEPFLRGLAQAFSPSQDALRREEAATVEAAFERLDDGDREVIVLARLVGLPRREIAEQLGVTEEAAGKRLARALARFAVALDSIDRKA